MDKKWKWRVKWEIFFHFSLSLFLFFSFLPSFIFSIKFIELFRHPELKENECFFMVDIRPSNCFFLFLFYLPFLCHLTVLVHTYYHIASIWGNFPPPSSNPDKPKETKKSLLLQNFYWWLSWFKLSAFNLHAMNFWRWNNLLWKKFYLFCCWFRF